MAAALCIGDEVSPSKMIGKSYGSQASIKNSIDLVMENSQQVQSSRNIITVGKLGTSESNSQDHISKASKRAMSGGRHPLENQDKSFQDVSKKNNFEEISIDLNKKKNPHSQNSEKLECQENNNQYLRGSFESQNDKPNDALSLEPALDQEILMVQPPVYDEHSLEQLKKDFFYQPPDSELENLLQQRAPFTK